jgi:(R,R)-butanediol dehydrogenase / meso-butanediol dehydrogenase / diacetyl reductase
MRAAVLEDGQFQIGSVPDPTPASGDLVLRVTGCGICGSDFKARPAMEPGTVMGHEFCGEVVAVGADVQDTWKEGMRAAVLPVFSCGACKWCLLGDVAHCANAALIGLGGSPGGFGEFVRTSAALSFPLPDDLPVEYGALVEPFAVGLHTARIANITTDDRVLVIGGGPVGLTTAAWVRELGAKSVTVSDPADSRRDAAASFGATDVVDPTSEELVGPYDVVIDCVGKPGLLDVCAQVADIHGRIVIAGVCADMDPYFPLVPLLKEHTIAFSVYYQPDEFRAVIDAFASGRVDPSPLITRSVGLADLNETFDKLMSAPDDLKVVVDPSA